MTVKTERRAGAGGTRKLSGNLRACCGLAALSLLLTPMPGGPAQAQTAAAGSAQEDHATAPVSRPRLPAEIIFESSLGDVVFPHKVHRRMGCQKCHHQLRAKVLDTPHDEYLAHSWVNCRSCHEESQSRANDYGCKQCHHSNLENIADETLSSKVVLHKSCWKCHLSGTGAEASERCGFCHVNEESPLTLSRSGGAEHGSRDTAVPATESGLE